MGKFAFCHAISILKSKHHHQEIQSFVFDASNNQANDVQTQQNWKMDSNSADNRKLSYVFFFHRIKAHSVFYKKIMHFLCFLERQKINVFS